MELKELIENKERVNVLISVEDLLELFRQVSGASAPAEKKSNRQDEF